MLLLRLTSALKTTSLKVVPTAVLTYVRLVSPRNGGVERYSRDGPCGSRPSSSADCRKGSSSLDVYERAAFCGRV